MEDLNKRLVNKDKNMVEYILNSSIKFFIVIVFFLNYLDYLFYMVHNCVFVCILVFIFFFSYTLLFFFLSETSKIWWFRSLYFFVFVFFCIFIFYFLSLAFPFYGFGYVFISPQHVLISGEILADVVVDTKSFLLMESLIKNLDDFYQKLGFFAKSQLFEISADVSCFDFLRNLQQLQLYMYKTVFFVALILLVFLTLFLVVLDSKNLPFILLVGFLTGVFLFIIFMVFDNLFVIKEVVGTPDLFMVDAEILKHIFVGEKSIRWYNDVIINLNREDLLSFFSWILFGARHFEFLSCDKPVTLFEFFLLRAKLLKYDSKKWHKLLWVGRFVQGAIAVFFKELLRFRCPPR